MAEVERGAMEPLPDYFHDVQLARWLGVTRAELDEMPIHEVEEARIVMTAINQAEHERNQKAAKR